ncbi:transcriptional regulator [Paracoccus suum]|uniref:Transcriptional regulator n=1 Tax=Paracoccus suum TaxID=2259340 RepID=A0A344PH84_9RHOB|nr:helix-turn-helix domain-containing protein [Paracoccus suum]AXC48739.1 transcriptional regulator [Paracoccus suum]
MAKPRRSYQQGCLAAHALDLIGDRWALLIVRELMLGPRRFRSLAANIAGIATNMLTARLEGLEAGGVISRQVLPPPSGVAVYALTPAGHGLTPVMDALCRWGASMPGHDPRLPISPASLMLSMRAQLRRQAADALPMEAGFQLGEEGFVASIRDGRYEVVRADPPQRPLLLTGAPGAMAIAVYGPRPLAEMAAVGAISVTGDLAQAQRFVDQFSLDTR